MMNDDSSALELNYRIRFIIDRIFVSPVLPLAHHVIVTVILLLPFSSLFYYAHGPRNCVDARHPRLAERSDKRCDQARLCRSFSAISCITCRHNVDARWILLLCRAVRLTFHGDRTYQRISRMPHSTRPYSPSNFPEDGIPSGTVEASGEGFYVVNCHLRETLLGSVCKFLIARASIST